MFCILNQILETDSLSSHLLYTIERNKLEDFLCYILFVFILRLYLSFVNYEFLRQVGVQIIGIGELDPTWVCVVYCPDSYPT